MKIVVIDGQGGSLGRAVVEKLKAGSIDAEIVAIGTNTIATSAMLKAGADAAATGENPVIVACREADIVVGPIGLIQADALLGEITPRIAAAVSSCKAEKYLIPVSRCKTHIAGIATQTISELIDSCIEMIRTFLEGEICKK